MAAALAMDDGLGCGGWFAAKPYVSPLTILTAPVGFRAIKLAGAFGDAAQAVDARLFNEQQHHWV